ncbi:MAG: FlgD immunoglobulin-like domain containing protein, partial [Candidatus Latescibacterota bacterium]
ATPQAFSLQQNYPNPFNSATTLRFDLPQAAAVELAVYNLAGPPVATLVQGEREAGAYAVPWDGRDAEGRPLASGVYLCQLRGGTHVDQRAQTRKLLLLR